MYLLDTFNYNQNSSTFIKEIIVPKKILSSNNIISIDYDYTDADKNNNTYFLYLDNEFFRKMKLLFISGSISSNTRFIKNNILNKIKNTELNHIYKINNKWSFNINELNSTTYDFIIYDNFPTNADDHKLLSDFIQDNKKIYFMGNKIKVSQINNFLKNYNCNLTINNNRDNNFIKSDTYIQYNNKRIMLPPNISEYYISCNDDDAIRYSNNNVFNFAIISYFATAHKV